MDTGQGGSNDNLFYGNDFSHAPTNGIEATFSRNTFANNRVEENWHGVWGGYSYDSLVNVALVAEAVAELPRGDFTLRTISDDGVRVYVDDKLVIDRWDIHESAVDEVPIRGGRRRLRVEYFERTGWAELRVEIVRNRTTLEK